MSSKPEEVRLIEKPGTTLLEWTVFIFAVIATLLFSFNAAKIGSLRKSRTLTRQEDESFPSMTFLYTANIIFAIISGLIALLALFFIFSRPSGRGISIGREPAIALQQIPRARVTLAPVATTS